MKKSISLALTALMALSFVGCNKDTHTHTFGDAWESDATHHWHNAECCDGVTDTKADHKGATATYTEQAICEDCGAPYGDTLTVDSVAEALEVGVAMGDKVTNGKIKQTYNSFGSVSTTNIIYEVAENYAYILTYGLSEYGADVSEKWYIAYGEDQVLALENQDGEVGKSYYESTVDMVNGYAFETIFDYTNTYYGVEEFVTAIYGLAEEKTEAIEEGVYFFSLTYVNPENNAKNEVNVGFTLNDEFIMDKVGISVDTYYLEDRQVFDEETGEPVVDEETGDFVYESVYPEDPDSSKYFEIQQVVGERFALDYVPEEVLPTTYTLVDGEGNEVTEINAEVGTGTELSFADIPEMAVLNWDTFTVTVYDAEGVETETAVNVYVSTYFAGSVTITPDEAGEYTVKIQSAFVTKEIKVTATLPATTELYAKQGWSYLTAAEIYADGALNFTVEANDYADASATVVVTTQPEGANATVTENQGEYTFASTVPGDYVLTITSVANSELVLTVNVTVKEVPNVQDLLKGMFQNHDKSKNANLMIEFDWSGMIIAAQYDGKLMNYSTYKYEPVDTMIALYSFTYDAETKVFTLTPQTIGGMETTDNLIKSITVNADYTISVSYFNGEYYANAKLVEYAPFTPAQQVEGEYYADLEAGVSRLCLKVNSDGTADLTVETYSNWMGWMGDWNNSVYFAYEITEDYQITVMEVLQGQFVDYTCDVATINSTIVFDKEAATVSFTFDGATVTLAE